jgi:hypothetical protein
MGLGAKQAHCYGTLCGQLPITYLGSIGMLRLLGAGFVGMCVIGCLARSSSLSCRSKV